MWLIRDVDTRKIYGLDPTQKDKFPLGITKAEFKAPEPSRIYPHPYAISSGRCAFYFSFARLSVTYQHEILDCKLSFEFHDEQKITEVKEQVREAYEKLINQTKREIERFRSIESLREVREESLVRYTPGQAEAQRDLAAYKEQGYFINSHCQRKKTAADGPRELPAEELLLPAERVQVRPSLIQLISSLPAELSPHFKPKQHYVDLVENFR